MDYTGQPIIQPPPMPPPPPQPPQRIERTWRDVVVLIVLLAVFYRVLCHAMSWEDTYTIPGQVIQQLRAEMQEIKNSLAETPRVTTTVTPRNKTMRGQ